MKLTLESAPFLQILEMLHEQSKARHRRFTPLTLTASRDRLDIQAAERMGQIDAQVWEAGRCVVSAERLLNAARQAPDGGKLTLHTSRGRLRVGKHLLAMAEPDPAQLAPRFGRCQVFLAASFGMVSTGLELAAR